MNSDRPVMPPPFDPPPQRGEGVVRQCCHEVKPQRRRDDAGAPRTTNDCRDRLVTAADQGQVRDQTGCHESASDREARTRNVHGRLRAEGGAAGAGSLRRAAATPAPSAGRAYTGLGSGSAHKWTAPANARKRAPSNRRRRPGLRRHASPRRGGRDPREASGRPGLRGKGADPIQGIRLDPSADVAWPTAGQTTWL